MIVLQPLKKAVLYVTVLTNVKTGDVVDVLFS